MRDLGDRAFLALALALREQLDASDEPGPEIVASGPPITVRAGHCHFLGGVAEGPQELLTVVGAPLTDLHAIHDVAAVFRAGRLVR